MVLLFNITTSYATSNWFTWPSLQWRRNRTSPTIYYQRDFKQWCKPGLRRPPWHSCTWILGERKVNLFRYKSMPSNCNSYKYLTPEQVYRLHENEKKRMYERWVLEVKQASFTPLVFTTKGGMGRKYLRYHSRHAELVSVEKGEDYAKTLT